jgi:hypothetical protein
VDQTKKRNEAVERDLPKKDLEEAQQHIIYIKDVVSYHMVWVSEFCFILDTKMSEL